MQSEKQVLHQNKRIFQANKLSKPRDFKLPKIIKENKQSQEKSAQSSLVLEIGAGKGKHALNFAKNYPDKQLIAIERTRNKFEAFTKLATLQKSANLLPIHADAIAWIVHAIAPNSVAPNGIKPNGIKPNSIAPNGIAPNSIAPNGISPNSIAPNVIAPNSIAPNSTAPNGIAPISMHSMVLLPSVLPPMVFHSTLLYSHGITSTI